MPDTVSVLLPIPAERPYTYRVPDGMSLLPGDIVQVPLGPRQVAAVVWEGECDEVNPAKLREVITKFDCPPLSVELRQFVDWVANYTLSPPGMVLRMVLRVPAALDPPAPAMGLQYTGSEPERMTAARGRVLELVRDGLAWSKSGLAHASGASSSVINGLVKLEVLQVVELPPVQAFAQIDPEFNVPELEPQQLEIAGELIKLTDQQAFSVALIDGVTGSGKTEVYFEAIARAIEQKKQVLILLPEIALTSTFLDRFEDRFGVRPGCWHSEITPKQREATWRQIAKGQMQVVAGARSALFLPFDGLGLVVVDEEHDGSYKQGDRVFYNARDMAIVRAQLAQANIILASATPSIESRVNADRGRYHYFHMAARYGEATLPQIETIDLRSNPPARGKFISPKLADEVRKTLGRNEQSLLFLNRRGYAPLTLCRVCGHRFQCPNCTAWLVEHRFRRQIQCHHCGHAEAIPEACPSCGTFDHLVACGPGVERLAEEVVELFPGARTLILSSDLSGGIKRLRLELEAIARGECDIIVGTQLVAKGHNFPLISCVGVVDADLGLSNGDPRAAERTFQLLSQVTGRAGRAGGDSFGFLQTYQPEHPVVQAIATGDREAFYEREIVGRQAAGLPPFGRLTAIIVSATTRVEAENHARSLRQCAPEDPSITVLGPAEAPIAILRERHRFRLLVHGTLESTLHAWLRSWFVNAPREKGSVRVQIDVDPQSFL